MQTHRELYPEQYAHRLVGKKVKVVSVKDGSILSQGKVERVVSTRWGMLAKIADVSDTFDTFYAVQDCTLVEG